MDLEGRRNNRLRRLERLSPNLSYKKGNSKELPFFILDFKTFIYNWPSTISDYWNEALRDLL